MNLITEIQERLETAFQPSICEVLDDSERHKGHAGSRDGGKHVILKIQAACFKDKSRVEVHREIYQVLWDLIPDKIHALKITVIQ